MRGLILKKFLYFSISYPSPARAGWVFGLSKLSKKEKIIVQLWTSMN